MCVGFVGEGVFPRVCIASSVEVGIREMKGSIGIFFQPLLIVFHCEVYASDVEVFGFLSRDFEVQRFERTDFRYKPEKERKHAGAETWSPVALAPFLLIGSSRQIVTELACPKIRCLLHNLAASRN